MPAFEPDRTARRAVIVLAAGRGRRMGGPKALMTVDGEPWWRVQARRLRDAGCTPIWVVSPEVRAAIAGAPDGPRALVEANPDAPMFDSLRAGVGHLGPRTPERLFVLPVDVPAPGRATWDTLATARSDGVAVPVHAGRRGHPICLAQAWVDRVLRPAFAAPPGPSVRLDGLAAPARTEVPVSDPAVVANLNTPADLATWLHGPA